MSLLHVAAMPFPSLQGTQAAVRAMIDAEHAAGRAPELLTYAHGSDSLDVPWPVHRIRDLVGDRSLRSGPSLKKLVEDAQLAVETRRRFKRSKPDAVIAHHVEAAAAASLARVRPFVFFAHTALGPELPTYLPDRVQGLASRAGEALDVALARRAHAVAAVAPSLADRLARAAERDVRYVPVPWSVPPAIDPAERAAARDRFGVGALDPVFLYAGNLDAYQGIALLLSAFALVHAKRPEVRLLVASASDTAALEDDARAAGIADAVRFASLRDEADRRVVHAAADAALVVRAAEGGLPIKLLDALARGVPTIATRRATAGLPLEGALLVARDDDAEALAAAALLTVEGREAAADLGRRGREYVRTAHSADKHLGAIDATLRSVR